jgi:glycosyltransferase involved in cell wall biosynthesis
MRILFIHQNFPGQFKHLAPALVQRGHDVATLTLRTNLPSGWGGVTVHRYALARGNTAGLHPWLVDLESKVLRADACLQAARQLAARGYAPDVIVAHPGWGESLFLRNLWPQARLGLYCEYHYQGATPGETSDVGFDPEFPVADAVADAGRLRLKTANNWLHFDQAAAGLAPTHWQASTFPPPFAQRITVAHDGIDTAALVPNPAAVLALDSGQRFTRHDEVITFVNRNIEPYRGCHVFMRMLPELLRQRPQAQVLIVGGTGVSYGSAPPQGQTWKDVFWDEVRGQLDEARVHFVGTLPYDRFVALLQISRVHVYLSYPFVLSWSLLEAMSCGATVVASDTAPVREAIVHERTGLLAGFFDGADLCGHVVRALQDADLRERLGRAARAHAVATYDLQTVCLPAQIAWVEGLA